MREEDFAAGDSAEDASGEAQSLRGGPQRPSEIVLIAALAESNRVIGAGMELPWHIPEDLRRFKRLTTGYPLVMGRRTFESLLHQFGRPLPGRENVVLTRYPSRVKHTGVSVFTSLTEALAAFADRDRMFIGGGAEVYRQALPLADRLELTLVERKVDGDTVFPPYRHLLTDAGGVFELIRREEHTGFRFETYRRQSGASGIGK